MKNITKSKSSVVCIVDAFSTGKKLAAEFAKYAIKCIHIRSTTRELGETSSNQFMLEIVFNGDFDSLAEEIKHYHPMHIIAGSEIGVELADKLSNALNLSSANDARKIPHRRNKYLMHEILQQAGLPHIKQFKSSEEDEIINWAKVHNQWPVIIKPINSAASDGVIICDNAQTVKEAFNHNFCKVNRLGILNEEVLIQEHIEGTQYFVNTVSWEGKHFVTDIWKQIRRRLCGKAYLFEGMTLCASSGTIETELSDYISKVLDLLGLQHGAAHSEVMWTENGPILIEVNARLMGASIDDRSFVKALGYTQVQALVLAYACPKQFIQQYFGTHYELFYHLAEVSFIYNQDGYLKDFPKKTAISNLASFHNFSGLMPIGSFVRKTEDTLGEPGYVYLMHKNEVVLLQDMMQAIQWQRDGELFEISQN